MTDPSTALALLPEQPAHIALSTLQRAAHDYDQQAKAVNTRKAYRVDWDDFTSWCVAHHLEPMPATPGTVRLYLVELAAAGAKVATIRRRLSTISVAHQMRGHENPAASAVVTTTMQGIKRTLGTAQTQKAPLVTADLARLIGSCEQLTPLAAARDRALLLVGATGGFRRSEFVALEVADVAGTKEGLEVTVRRSKSDQDAAGAVVAIPYGSHPHTCPVRALEHWLDATEISAGPLWREVDRHGNLGSERLHVNSVVYIVKRACRLSGLDPARYAGHSLRSGMATSAAAGGAPERAIMRQGRWSSRAMVDRYVRHGTLWQECAAAYMGL